MRDVRTSLDWAGHPGRRRAWAPFAATLVFAAFRYTDVAYQLVVDPIAEPIMRSRRAGLQTASSSYAGSPVLKEVSACAVQSASGHARVGTASLAVGVPSFRPERTPPATGALAGAIDVHVHSYPDDRPRSIHAIDVARAGADARNARDRAQEPLHRINCGHRVSRAAGRPGHRSVRRHRAEPDRWRRQSRRGRSYGARLGRLGAVVWMPTFDAENQVRSSKENRPFVPVSRNGELLPEVKTVIGLIAKHGLVLALVTRLRRKGSCCCARPSTGRAADDRHARHPAAGADGRSQMKEAASLGAFIEFVGGSPEGPGAAARLDGIAAAIRQVPPGVAGRRPRGVTRDLGGAGIGGGVRAVLHLAAGPGRGEAAPRARGAAGPRARGGPARATGHHRRAPRARPPPAREGGGGGDTGGQGRPPPAAQDNRPSSAPSTPRAGCSPWRTSFAGSGPTGTRDGRR